MSSPDDYIDHDDEIIRRPMLVTLAAIIWYFIGLVLIVLTLGAILFLLYASIRIDAGHFLCFAVVTASINVPIGMVCLYLARKVFAGVYQDVFGFGIASFVIGLILASCGVNGIITNLTKSPLISTLYISLGISTFGNWFLLAGIFMLISRRRYVRWSRIKRMKTIPHDRLDDV